MKLVFKLVFVLFSCFLCHNFFAKGAYPEEDVYKYVKTECNEQIDFHIVVDSSGSIGLYNWRFAVAPLVKQIVNSLDISKENVNISLILFSTSYKILIPIGSDTSYNKRKAQLRIHNLEFLFMKGWTYLHTPIENVINRYISQKMVRPTAAQMILILTDGVPNEKRLTTEAIQHSKSLGAIVGILGIGNKIDRDYNRSLVGCDKTGECKLYMESSWKDVQQAMKPFLKTICREVEQQESCGKFVWGECSVTCGRGTRPGYRIPNHQGCKASTTIECVLPDCPISVPDTLPENTPETSPENTLPDTEPTVPGDSKASDIVEEAATETIIPGYKPVLPPKYNTDEKVPEESEKSKTPEAIDEPAKETTIPQNTPDVPPQPNTMRREPVPSTVNPSSNDVKIPDETKKAEEESNKLAENTVEEELNKFKNEKEIIEESSSVPVVVPTVGINDHKNETEQPEENEEERKGTSSNNGFKIAGGLVGGVALIGAGFAGYKFLTASSAASALHTEGVPFDDVAAEGEKDFEETEQFRLPDENEWN